MKKKLLFIIDHLCIGGSQEFILNYCHHIKVHEVTVLSIFGDDVYSKRIENAGAKIIFLTKKKYNYLNILSPKSYLAYKKYIKSNIGKFDFIVLRLFASFMYSSFLSLYKFKNVWPSIDANSSQLPFVIKTLYFLYASKYAKFFLSTQLIEEYKYLFLDLKNIYDGTLFITQRKKSEQYPFKTKLNILSIGRCIKQKGHLQLIQLFNILQKKTNLDIGLHIIGAGSELLKLKKYVQLNNINNVFFHGNITNLDPIFTTATLIVKLSIGEGINSIVREALLCGIPVATTIETHYCETIYKKKTFIKLDRNDLNKSAETIKDFLNAKTTINIENIKKTANDLWGSEAIKSYYLKLFL